MTPRVLASWLRAFWLEFRAAFKTIFGDVAISVVTLGLVIAVELLTEWLVFTNNQRSILTLMTSVFRRTIFALLGVSSLIIIFTVLIRFRLRASSEAKQLKQLLQDAFIQKIDDSSLNPTRQIGERHV